MRCDLNSAELRQRAIELRQRADRLEEGALRDEYNKAAAELEELADQVGREGWLR